MKQISPYLTFSGNCREAMTFYQACLGGELNFQTIGESPLSDKMPRHMKDYILHASLSYKNIQIFGTDMVWDEGLQKGNAVSLMLDCGSEKELRSLFGKLSEEGTPRHGVEHTFWGAYIGDLTDRYGNSWLLHYEGKKQKKSATL